MKTRALQACGGARHCLLESFHMGSGSSLTWMRCTLKYLRFFYTHLWDSLSVASFSLVLCIRNSCCLGFPGLSFISAWSLLGSASVYPLCAVALSWGHGLAHLFGFLCLGDHCPTLRDIQSLENHYLMYFVCLKFF